MSARKSAVSTKKRSDAPRGQAMVEYSVVTHFLLVGGALALLPVMGKLFESFGKFYDSVFFVLCSGAI